MRALGSPGFFLVLPVIGVALALPAVWTGMQLEDHVQSLLLTGHPIAREWLGSRLAMFDFADGDPARFEASREFGIFPWWASETFRLKLLRPVAVLTHLLDYRLWPGSVALMHIHSLAWLAVLVYVASRVHRRFMGAGWVAGLAGLLYAVDDGHATPVTWIACRNGIMAAVFGLLVLLTHDRWRRGGSRWWALAGPVLLLTGLLSNEGALAVCAYLLAYAVFIEEGRPRARFLALLPYGATIVAWRIVYNMLGYGAGGSVNYFDPVRSPAAFLQAAVVRGPILLLGQWLLPPPDTYIILDPVLRFWHFALAALFLLFVGYVAYPLLRRDRIAQFWACGALLCVVPVCATWPMDRLMLFAGVGATALAAQLIEIARGRVDLPRYGWLRRKALLVLCVLVVLTQVVAAPILWPMRILAFDAVSDQMVECLKSAELDDSVQDCTLVLVNVPNTLYTYYLPFIQTLEGEPVPARIRSLAPTTTVPAQFTVSRTDDRTLVVDSAKGSTFIQAWDKELAPRPGDTIELSDVAVTLESFNTRGFPKRVTYRFASPLEDSRYLWLMVENNRFVPFELPNVGETLTMVR